MPGQYMSGQIICLAVQQGSVGAVHVEKAVDADAK